MIKIIIAIIDKAKESMMQSIMRNPEIWDRSFEDEKIAIHTFQKHE